jgi:multiple sugar transport system ATP-binding protein
MAEISLKHVYKIYDNKVVAVSDFNLDIHDKEFVVFVGPSGCGKSTTLRMIAGLEHITSGDLYLDGERINDIPPKDRNMAMVFQNYALYPYMTVYENMSFALKLKKVPKAEIKKKVMEAAEILGLTDYLDRKPKELSGGQCQRVALGRAIVRNPKVFLLDEPLSNLDAKLRNVMRSEITKLHNRLQTTFVYVTHDQIEAMTMGTKIVVMKEGVIQQVDTPQNLYHFPYNRFVAGFIGTPQMNFLQGTIDKTGKINFPNGRSIQLSQDIFAQFDEKQIGEQKEVIVGVRPEDLYIQANGDLICRVDTVENAGSECILYGSLNLLESNTIVQEGIGEQLIIKTDGRCEVTRDSIIELNAKEYGIHLFDAETGLSLLKRYAPVTPVEEPAASTDEADSVSVEETATSADEPNSNAVEEPAPSADEPVASDNEPASLVEESAASADEPNSSPVEEPATSIEETASLTEQPAEPSIEETVDKPM